MIRVKLFFLIFLFICSCKPRQGDDQPGIIPLPEKIPANPLEISGNKKNTPDTINITTLDRVPMGIADKTPANKSIRKQLTPKIVKAGTPRVVIPGEKNIPEPKTITVENLSSVAGVPTATEVQNAYLPLQNSQSFSYYTRQHGLQHDDISATSFDKAGNMWIGTYGAGIIRFDGNSFFQYTDKEGLSQNYIQSLITTTTGDIWIGTRAEGAIRFDGKQFHYYNTDNGLNNNRVEAIVEDRNGNIWLGSYEGVNMYDGTRMVSYTSEHLGADIVYVALEDNDGNMWFGTRGGGITRFDGTAFYQYTKEQGLISDYIVTGMYDSRGNLWLGSYESGATRFDGKDFYHYTSEHGLDNNLVRSFAEDKYGYIWMGSATGGLSRIKNNQLEFFTIDHGLTNSYITSITEDEKGIIWFGTYGGGLGIFQGNIFSHFYERHGINDGFVRSIMQDNDGYLWFGTNSAGAIRFDGNTFESFTTEQGLSHNRVGSMLQDNKGNIWFGTTGGGINRFDGTYLTRFSEKNGFPDDFILDMTEDTKGNLWFATRNSGVVKYDGDVFYHYTEKQGLSDNNTRCIISDRNGNIWTGTRAGGLNKFDGTAFTHYTEKGGMSSDNLLDILEDASGNIWIATNGKGISKFDGANFTHYTEREGLINNFVYSLLETDDGTLWAGTRMGLSKLLSKQPNPENSTPNSPGGSILFKNYTQHNGFLGIGVNSRAMTQDKEGKIWIGANDILTVYNPSKDIADTIAPRIQIKKAGLFNEDIQWDQIRDSQDSTLTLPNGVRIENFSFDSVSRWHGLPHNLSLAYDNNYITLGFVAIGSSFVDKPKYSYILEGLESNWSSLTSKTEVSYGNLPPGKYDFRVRAINNDGFWSDDYSFAFRIKPPAWRTWWAYILYASAFILFLLLLYKFQKNRLMRKDLEKQKELYFEQEVSLARKSAEFKQNFLANMSHEIRTPLTAVLGMASLLRQQPLDPKALEYVEDLNKSGESLRETINMILDISKIEAGKLYIRKADFSLHNVISHSANMFSPLCKNNVTIEYSLDEDIPAYIYSDEQRISQIIKNMLSNAVKFTEQGKITLKATRVKEMNPAGSNEFFIKVFVCDTGPGISREMQEKLFTPFYQINRSATRSQEGTGLGLAICKELSLLLGGQIGVESKPGEGSCFWFTFLTSQGEEPQQTKESTSQASGKDDVRPLKILMVEDKPIIQKVIKLTLSSMGHSIVVAGNGQEALEAYAQGSFDLILMDIQMPVMDGITATRKLREKYAQLPPIVGLSANAFEGDRQKYMAQGLDEYITKPFRENDFKRLLSKLGIN